MSEAGASIRIFLPTGDPEGVRIVTRSHWTGSAVVCPRAEWASAASNRPELARPGVYVLIGPASSPTYDARIYIGETDKLRKRIGEHNRDKDFWTRVIAFSSSDGALNKALVKYLESRLVALAQAAGRVEVEMGTGSEAPALSEPDRADAEAFLSDMLVVYPLIGVTAFEAPPTPAAEPQTTDLFINSTKAQAQGREVGERFVVFSGATLAPVAGSLVGSLADLRTSLLAEGRIVPADDGSHALLQDRTFQSPSYAAAFVLGRSANGRIEWKNADGRTLKDLASEQSLVS